MWDGSIVPGELRLPADLDHSTAPEAWPVLAAAACRLKTIVNNLPPSEHLSRAISE